jgi:hypothetical protein
MADFFPSQDPKQVREFIVAFLAALPTNGSVVGITAGDQSGLVSAGNAAINGIDLAVTAENAADSLRADRKRLIKEFGQRLRPIVRRAKAHPSYTETIGEALGVISDSPSVDPGTIKPTITAAVNMGHVSLRIRRPGAESVVLFCRCLGQTEWRSLGRVTRASYIDPRPLAQPGVPEVREYMAQGYIGDEQVGLPSDSKTVVFAGSLAA